VGVSAYGQGVVLSVIDDGHGFDVGDIEAGAWPGHFGLRLMRDLADPAGGALQVQSSPGSGTSVRLDVPVT
jgi:signal transduction histidine kinase